MATFLRICAVLLLLPPVAMAQTARSSAGDANAQLQAQLQQLANESAALKAENGRLKRDSDTLRKERDALQAKERSLEDRGRSASAAAERNAQAKETAERELEQLREKSDELVARFRETAQTLRDVEKDRATLRTSLADRERELASCSERNAALYQLNLETIAFVENEGFWSRLGRSEPFTQLQRVKVENQMSEFRALADDQMGPQARPAEMPPAPAP
jgi:chromosome segregation ATPase